MARKHLPAALGGELAALHTQSGVCDGIVGWGVKDNTRKARERAAALGLPYLCLEDGFVRSLGLGVQGAEPFSFVVDESGIFYDATRESDLEMLLAMGDQADGDRARSCIDRLVSLRVSKYNQTWRVPELPGAGKTRVLLIDQTEGDLSVVLGGAGPESFATMLQTARERFPGAALLVKTHPDVIAGKRKGYLTADLPQDVHLLQEDCNPMELLLQVDHVFTVTSQMGFEALLAGKSVTCFGMPFYAGWGITEDMVSCPRRIRKRTLEQVFEAAYLRYARYVDPVTGSRCDLERILDRIESHKRMMAGEGKRIFCFGFKYWKRSFVRTFLPEAGERAVFAASMAGARRKGLGPGDGALVWGLKGGEELDREISAVGADLMRMEDGFIRSVGLGSDFARPASLIVDSRGIYFDPRRGSDLEHLLNTVDLSAADLARAEKLREMVVSGGVTKYNWGGRGQSMPTGGTDRRTILVPGQVEDDASIKVGCVDVRTNLDLLRAVRQDSPEAFIVYKPHPDVLSRNRQGAVAMEEAHRECDAVVTDLSMDRCLEAADEVHTMTSLSGFEALMRGKEVVVYGLPFYAGWGVTRDLHRIDRRVRTRSVDELVFCTLVLYPRYYDWDCGLFVEVEDVVDKLQKVVAKGDVVHSLGWFERLGRKLNFLKEDLLG